MDAEIKSETSKSCKHCCILFYIKKIFKKHDSICDICYDMLDDDRDSSGLHIVWTENQKFRNFANIYQYSVQRLMQIEQPKNIAGFLDLRHKYKGQYSVWFWHQGEPSSYNVLVELDLQPKCKKCT